MHDFGNRTPGALTGPTIVQLLTSGDAGGGQLVSLSLSRKLADQGYNVRFATPGLGSITRQCAEVGVVDVVPWNSLRQLQSVGAIARYLRDCKAVLLHTHTPIAASILWRLGARIAGVPVVHHVHTANFYGPRGIRSSVARRLDRATVRIVSCSIAVSETTRKELVALGYPEGRVHTVYNTIPFNRRPRIEPSSSADLVIGCIGRISVMKGQGELLEAFASVKTRFPGARLWIIGAADAAEHGYEAALHARMAALGVAGSVTFWGHRDDVEQLIPQLSMLVLPSKHEAFPLVLLEAMSIGIPVIATDTGGVSELVRNDHTGVLIPMRNHDALVEAIADLASSAGRREALSSAAYDFVWSRFDAAATLEPAIALIRGCVKA